jgi:gliding motility-associated-like protein
MKKYLLLPLSFLAFFCCLNNAWAQPSVCVIEPYIDNVTMGSEVCVQFVVNDFTDLTSMSFDVFFDEDKVNYLSHNVIANAATPPMGIMNLDNNDFDITNVGIGQFRFEWDGPLGTLEDGTALFELCFTAVDDLGYSEIEIVGDRVTRTISGNFNIGFEFIKDGWIQIGEDPLVVNIPTVAGLQGETVCMNFTVDNFFEMLAIQGSIHWDETALQLESSQGIEPISGGSFNFASPPGNPGTLTFTWVDNDGQNGVSIEDGTSFIQLCFVLIGDCTTNNPVFIDDSPTITEAVTVTSAMIDPEDPPVGIYNNPGSVTIDCIQPGAPSFCIPDVSDICPGETFTMNVTAQDFESIRRMDFSINWNPSVLQLDNIIETTDLPSFVINPNVGGGFATCNWQSGFFGNSLADGVTAFTLEFTVVGGGGSNSTVSITGTPETIFFTDQSGPNPEHIGYNSCNAFFQACSPTGITVSASDATADPGAPVCVDVTVQDFDDITELAFSMDWEPSVVNFVEVNNFNLPGLSAANFNLGGSNFGISCLESWTSPTGVSLPDGATIFSICFEADNNPLACGAVGFSNSPCEQVVMQENVGFDIGMNSNPGEICINNPEEFVSTIGSTGGAQGAILCVDVAVENFQNLGEMEYSVNWNPTVLDFIELQNSDNLTNLNTSSFDEADVDNGNLTVDWSSPGGSGTTLTDGTIIYTLCFQLIGTVEGCAPISFTNTPLAINVESNNSTTNIGMQGNNGEICLVPALSSTAAITGVSCTSSDNCDGEIDITISGGNGTYVYEWIGPGINAANMNNEDQTGLCEGIYVVEINDTDTGLSREDVYTIETSGTGPIAEAGPDTTLNCGSVTMTLDATNNGTSVGGQYSYLWSGETGNVQVFPDSENTLMPQIAGSNDYLYFEVTDNNLGCTVRDSLFILSAVTPITNAGNDLTYDCLTESLTLDGTESEEDENFIIDWLTEDGASIEAGTNGTFEPTALTPGTYVLTITNPFNECVGQDTVLIEDIRTEPIAVANSVGLIDCGNDMVTLDGTGSTVGTTTFEWTVQPSGSVLSNSIMATTMETGWHYFTVTDNPNGCTAVDSVLIQMDMDVPNGSAGMNMDFFCNTTSVILMGEGPTEPGNYSYNWEGQPDSPPITDATTLTPTVFDHGTYFLTILNIDTGCDAVFSVVVEDETALPVADAGMAVEINCANITVQLDGTASDANMEYAWTNGGNTDGITDPTTLTPTVDVAGTYTLTVTNPTSQCIATADVIVSEGAGIPEAIIADTDAFFNCEVDEITLDATASTNGQNYEYTWTGNCLDDISNEQNPIISCGGTYTLVVVDTVLNCVSETAMIVINEDSEVPTIVLEEEVLMPCGFDAVVLDATLSSSGDMFDVMWTIIAPGSITDETTLNPTVTAGSYGLSILNNVNGCETVASVVVTANSVTAAAGMNMEIACEGGGVDLDGTASTPDVIYAWTYEEDGMPTGITNPTTLTPTVTLVGTYTLTVTDATGMCTATDEVQVIGIQPPVANAGTDVPLTCEDEFVTIDGSESDMGDDITYEWTTADGNFVSTDLTLSIIDVDALGTYVLTVTRADGCFSTDSVIVFADAGNLTPSIASVEHDICETTAALTGNLPDGTTGLWTSNNGTVDFANDGEGSTTAENIPGGEILMIWTLSTEGCPSYGADTILVITEFTPNATDDEFTLEEGEQEITFDLFENDVTTNIPSFTFTNTDPTIGLISENVGDGMITYLPQIGVTGAAVFDYTICNTDCPMLCDSADVTLTLDGELDLDNLPNTITPNGDGLNDILIFDILNTGNYPENSIIIFNRWGDEVHVASPYNNDWGGTFQGNLLPQGTYYYIMRLSLGEGEVVKGDITILR